LVARRAGPVAAGELAAAVEATAAGATTFAPLPTAGKSVISVGVEGSLGATALLDKPAGAPAALGGPTVADGKLVGVPGEMIVACGSGAAGLAGGSMMRIGGEAAAAGVLLATPPGGCCQALAEITLVSVAGWALVPPAGAAVG